MVEFVRAVSGTVTREPEEAGNDYDRPAMMSTKYVRGLVQ